jgi:acyl-CoA synthetase (NDP forming)/GNAT superfamily N-acetyltransferase
LVFEGANDRAWATVSDAMGPPELECDVLSADGAVLHVRPIRPDDGDRLVAFHEGLSPETVYRRFFAPHPHLPAAQVEQFTHVDYLDRLGLVVEHEDRLVAVARYERLPGTGDAEVAFVVADAYQGRGLGTLLLEHLAAAARARGVLGFVASILATNSGMLAVFGDAGFTLKHSYNDGMVELEFPIEPTAAFQVAVEARDHQAEQRSIQRLLRPASVAVVGASARPGGVGHGIVENIVDGGFAGPVFPVNRRGDPVAGRRGYARLADIDGPVDLVVAAVGPEDTIGLVADAARLGAQGLVVISAGFAEAGPDGAVLQQRLVAEARHHGLRIVGPNCLGLANTDPSVALNATFAPVAAIAGPAGLFSQSGAVGIVALEQAARIGLGLSSFVSGGNKADVSGNDLLDYWSDDPATDVVCLYLESVGNPRRFARLARRVSRTKAIVAVKAGRSDAGRRAASSHTAAAASSDVAVDALFAHAGVIRAATLTEMFDTALVLAEQPLPAGGRIAVVGNSGGPGILAADACSAAGLELPPLGAPTQAALRAFLPPTAAVTNPVDLLASADGKHYQLALEQVLADPGIDAVIVIYTSLLVSDPDDVAAGVVSAATGTTKPVIACFLGATDGPGALRRPAGGARPVPCLPTPERAAQALARVRSYRVWRDRPDAPEPSLTGIDGAAARRVVADAMARPAGGGWLDAPDAWALLRAYGLPLVEVRAATSADEAVAAAAALGYPVALKAASGRIVHKSDAGGVALALADADAVRGAFDTMNETLAGRMGGAIVQPMAAGGIETIVGVVRDDAFGPLVMFGLGGVATDLLGDRSFRSTPISGLGAQELVRSLRSSPLLQGYRGAAPADLAALEDVILRAGRLADDIPELAELDLNPVLAAPSGALILDVKVRLSVPPPVLDPWLRQLR